MSFPIKLKKLKCISNEFLNGDSVITIMNSPILYFQIKAMSLNAEARPCIMYEKFKQIYSILF